MLHVMTFKLALITGATSGIGETLCYLLAEKGINLLITGRNQEALERLQRELSVEVTLHQADLLKEQDSLVTLIHKHRPDLIINNAGFGLYGPALEHSTDAQLEILNLNSQAVLRLTLEGARMMKENGIKGVVLNVSSVAAFFAFPNFAVYAASKAFVNSFSEAFDFEMQAYGIRVLSACPGQVATRFRTRAALGRDKETKRSSMTMTPEFAAKEIVEQIEKNKPVHTFNWRYRLFRYLQFFVPKKFLLKRLSRGITTLLPQSDA